MTDRPGWRRVFDAVERNASPRVEALVHSGEFSGLLFPTRRRVTARRADGAAVNGPILVSIDFGEITVR